MATRLFTSFMMPHEDDILADNKIKYWVDVAENYDEVFNKKYPLTPAASTLEARENFNFTKLDGGRFSCMGSEICGFEELVVQ